MTSMTVRDAMHVGVVSCDSSISVHEAASMMNETKLRSLVVVDFDCALAGIISESDIVAVQLLNDSGRTWDKITVGEMMTNRVLTVTPDMDLKEAAKIMVDHRIHRVVVAELDDLCNPIGMLSMGDIMRYVELGDEASQRKTPAGEAAMTQQRKVAAKKKPAAKKPATKKPAAKKATAAKAKR
jgi:CBS domain-containing protein